MEAPYCNRQVTLYPQDNAMWAWNAASKDGTSW
jgi:hypothetical protein